MTLGADLLRLWPQRKRANTVKGTATAASLWATGAIGVSVGLGSYDVAIVLLITIATLWPLAVFKRKIIGDSKPKRSRKNDPTQGE